MVDGVGASQPFELCGVCRRHREWLDVAHSGLRKSGKCWNLHCRIDR